MELPIFPLHTVLFPGGALALKIFEQRYLEMTKVCLRDGTPFGVCLIAHGKEVGAPALPVEVGCTARIVDWEMPQPGMFHLDAQGGGRFRLRQSRSAANGLITGEVDLLPDGATDAAVDPVCRETLQLILQRIGKAAGPAAPALDDAAWVGFRLAELLPFALPFKQQLLELDDAGRRLELIRGFLAAQGVA